MSIKRGNDDQKRAKAAGVPVDVAMIRRGVSAFFDQTTADGFALGTYYGVYVFFDYDNEPIYVGQSRESLRARVGRHMTNQRTDAVAMNVLDPFEVAWIEAYPLHHPKLSPPVKENLAKELDALEYTVFQKVLKDSSLNAVLNEKDLIATPLVTLPTAFKQRIIPDEMFEQRNHPDIRIARRANTIARLAQVISERDVSAGLRRTLLTQARRLERLAAERFSSFEGSVPVAHGDDEES